MPPKVVAVDLTPILPGGENGGAKIFVLTLVEGLAKLAPDTRFVLLTNAVSHDELCSLESDSVECKVVVGVKQKPAWFLRACKQLSSLSSLLPYRLTSKLARAAHFFHRHSKKVGTNGLLRELGVDVLFCPFTAPTYHEPGIPVVSTLYDLQYKTYPQFFSSADVIHRDQTFKDASEVASILVPISNYTRASCIQHSKIPESDIQTIYLKMAQRVSTNNDEYYLRKFGVKPKEYLIFPANFWKHKNHEMLLTAFGMAVRQGLNKQVKLVLTGAASDRSKWLETATERLGLSERVVITGFVTNDELAQLMKNSKGMVFPSLYEGFGLPIIEAMAVGVPVACSDLTSMPEVAGGAAILFNPKKPNEIANAMRELTENQALCDALVEKGRARSEFFSNTDEMVQQYWEVLVAAYNKQQNQSSLSGVYEDKWLGRTLNIKVSSESTVARVEIAVNAPTWLEKQPVLNKVKMHQGKRVKSVAFTQLGGDIVIPIDTHQAELTLEFSRCFVPNQKGLGDDGRELSVQLEEITLCDIDNHKNRLYPKNN